MEILKSKSLSSCKKMERLFYNYIIIAVFAILCVLVNANQSQPSDGIVDYLLGKTCNNDTDCQKNQCCVPAYASGNRCRAYMTEGTICASFTEELIKRLHRRCPCEPGTKCKNTGSVLKIYKIYKCVKDGN